MAPTNTPFDRSNQFGQEIKALLNAYRKVTDDGPLVLEAMSHMIDGDGSDVAHFAEMVTLGIYETTADAKASYDELASSNAKVTNDSMTLDDSLVTDNGNGTHTVTTNVNAALKQVCAKHGII